MRHIFVLLLVMLVSTTAMAQTADGWAMDENVIVSALRVYEAKGEGSRDDAKLDATLMAGGGAGICFTYTKNGSEMFRVSPLTLLVTADTDDEDRGYFNLSYATTIGFYQNKVFVGVCYDFGEAPSDRSRISGIAGVGFNFGE